MPDFRLIYRGNGAFQAATKADWQMAEHTFQAGEEVAGKLTHKRSVRQNNTFHAMCQYAFDNQRAGPEFASWEMLKAWVLIRAGKYTERRHSWGKLSIKDAKMIGAAMAYSLRQRVLYVEVAYDPNTFEFVEREAESIRFTKTMSDEMGELFDKVVNILCEQIIPGTNPDDLVEMVKSSMGLGRRQQHKRAA